jgi:uncharacterized protein (TIGR02246 family)
VGGPTSAEEVLRDFIAAFVEAWPTGDAAPLSRFFSEDAEYCNGPLEPVHGRDAIVADLARTMSLGGEVQADIRRLLSDGAVVMTERVGRVRLGGKRAAWRLEVSVSFTTESSPAGVTTLGVRDTAIHRLTDREVRISSGALGIPYRCRDW